MAILAFRARSWCSRGCNHWKLGKVLLESSLAINARGDPRDGAVSLIQGLQPCVRGKMVLKTI